MSPTTCPPCFSHSSAVSAEPPSPLLGAGAGDSAFSAGAAGVAEGGVEPPQATSNSKTDETARRELMPADIPRAASDTRAVSVPPSAEKTATFHAPPTA